MTPIAVLTRLAGLAGLAMVADLGLSWLAATLAVPFPLDSVGTATAGAVGGPVFGIVIGLAGGALVGTVLPGSTPVGVALMAHAIVGVSAGLAARAGALRTLGRCVPVGAAVGLATACAALLWPGPGTTVATLLRNGASGASWVVVVVGAAAEVLDKALAFALAGFLLRHVTRGERLAPGRHEHGTGA